jgi:hypothetical protein
MYKTGGKLFKTLSEAVDYANAIHAQKGVILGIERV